MRKKEKPKGAHLVRKAIREVLGLTFWIHAIYVLGLVPLPSLPAPDLPRHLFNAVLVAFIVNYSIFTNYGWWSVALDLLYIYFLPFIYFGKVAWWLGGQSFKSAKKRIVWQSPRLIPDIPNTQSPTQKNETAKAETKEDESKVTGISRRLIRVFLQFGLLWSVLILTVNWKPFIVLAIVVTFLATGKAIWILWDVFSGGTEWVDKIESRFAEQIKNQIDQIRQWNGSVDAKTIKQAINVLKFHQSILSFITENSSILTKWAFTASLVVSVPFYCYISFLFSCVYFAIAKLSSIDLSFPYAFVDSLFMPFAWSALPNSLLIRFIGGLQATCVAVIGYNILFRHLGSRLEKITAVAVRLRSPFEEELLKARMRSIEEELLRLGTSQVPIRGAKALPIPKRKPRR